MENLQSQKRHRINRAINFAFAHRYKKLNLATLAEVACFSKDHFLRVFSNNCGETPAEFCTRLRLENSVTNLSYHPHMSITEIAFDAGYQSPQAYCDAFRTRYRISPRNFRQKNRWFIDDFPTNQHVLSPILSDLPKIGDAQFQFKSVVVKKFHRQRLAYIRYRGSYYGLTGGRKATIDRLYSWAERLGLWQEDTRIIGIGTSNPAITPPQFCQYDLGIPVDNGVDEDATVSIREMPETEIATLQVTGNTQTVRAACKCLSSQWFRHSGMVMANHPCFEFLLPVEGGPGNMTSGVILCMPVQSVSNARQD